MLEDASFRQGDEISNDLCQLIFFRENEYRAISIA